MPSDIYDYSHKRDYDEKIDVYAKDNIDEVVDNLLSKYDLDSHVIKTMKQQILDARNGLAILESRYITCISKRIMLYTMEEDMGYGIRNRQYWCLINVWRAN